MPTGIAERQRGIDGALDGQQTIEDGVLRACLDNIVLRPLLAGASDEVPKGELLRANGLPPRSRFRSGRGAKRFTRSVTVVFVMRVPPVHKIQQDIVP